MSGAARPPHDVESGSAWYVYGVVPAADAPPDLFAAATGMRPPARVIVIQDGGLAAVASEVPLEEFGEGALDDHLRDPAWLAEKARAHDEVLELAVGRTPLVPFRFGTIVHGRDQVPELLRGRRDLSELLERLRGTVELGVKAFLDLDRFRARRGEEEAQPGSQPPSGTAYLLRKQADRQLQDDAAALKASCGEESHRRLAAVSEDARANALQPPEVAGANGEMLLNGAYLVRDEGRRAFAAALDELRERFAPEGVDYGLTGPWPPYNFVEGDEGE